MTNKRPVGRPKGSKNKSHISLTNEDLAELQKMTRKEKSELDKLKNLVARQDDQIIQMCDEISEFKKDIESLNEDIGLLEGKIESYREILKTLLEITE